MRILTLLSLSLLLSTLAAAAPLAPGVAPPIAAAPAPAASDPSVPTDEPPVEAALPFTASVDDVLAMMARAPATEFGKKPYPKWAKTGQANRIAKAISDHATSLEEAGDMVVYGLYEAGNRVDLVGDGGHSFGPWQLSDKHASPSVAKDPDQAAPIWLDLAERSRSDCSKLPEEDRLAELASGSCDRGRKLARRRAKLRALVLGD